MNDIFLLVFEGKFVKACFEKMVCEVENYNLNINFNSIVSLFVETTTSESSDKSK